MLLLVAAAAAAAVTRVRRLRRLGCPWQCGAACGTWLWHVAVNGAPMGEPPLCGMMPVAGGGPT